MAKRVLAAVAQLTSTPDVTQNLSVASDLIRRARHIGASMIFLPEASDLSVIHWPHENFGVVRIDDDVAPGLVSLAR